MEVALEKFVQQTTEFITETRAKFKNQDARIKNFEGQIGQIAQQLYERPQCSFSSDTVVNPKEHCNAISLRSGKVLKEIEGKEKSVNEESEKSENLERGKDEEKQESVKEKEGTPKGKKESEKKEFHEMFPERVPYPQMLKKREKESQFERFLKVFKK